MRPSVARAPTTSWSSTDVDGYKALAVAVLAKALADARGEHGAGPRTRDEARTFLDGGDALELWADLAGIDPAAVRRAARPRS